MRIRDVKQLCLRRSEHFAHIPQGGRLTGFLPAQSALYILAAMFMAGCSSVPALDGDAPEEEIVRYHEREKGVPHCSVACVRAGRASFGGDPRLIYRIGSLTKLFLRPAFVALHDAGRIDLDASVVGCAPFALPEEYRAVTLRDLMENRSGLPRELLNPWNPIDVGRAILCGFCGVSLYAPFEEVTDFADALGGCRARSCIRDGTPRYSNVGFALLALSVERQTGSDIDDLFAEAVARPRGLADTSFAPSPASLPRVTPPCAGDLPWIYPRGSVVPDHPLGPALRGTGALFSSAADCARFFQSEWGYVDLLLSEKAMPLCADGEDRGLLRVKHLPSGRSILFRSGMIYGGASFVCFEPSSRTILVMLRNVTSWPSDDDFMIADRIVSR